MIYDIGLTVISIFLLFSGGLITGYALYEPDIVEPQTTIINKTVNLCPEGIVKDHVIITYENNTYKASGLHTNEWTFITKNENLDAYSHTVLDEVCHEFVNRQPLHYCKHICEVQK